MFQTDLNLDEVLTMAEWIERQSATFYRKLAEKVEAPAVKQTLLEMVRMEQDHAQVVLGLREVLHTPAHERGKLALDRILPMLCLDIQSQLQQAFDGNESVEEVIRKAIDFEKDTIVFYTMARDMLPPGDRDKMDVLVREELGHILTLSAYFMPLARDVRVNQDARPWGNSLHSPTDIQ